MPYFYVPGAVMAASVDIDVGKLKKKINVLMHSIYSIKRKSEKCYI